MATLKQHDMADASPIESEVAAPPPRFAVETRPGGSTSICRSEQQPVGDWFATATATCGIGDLDAVMILISKTIEASTVQPPTTDSVNGVVALLRAIAPKDATEGMLAARIVATHQGAMECLRRAMLSE